LEGRDRGFIEIKPKLLLGGTEENYEEPEDSRCLAAIRTEHLPDRV
jgi:hypothetical protein